MTLEQKLSRLKEFKEIKNDNYWESYKEVWKLSVQEIEKTFVDNWFAEYAKKGLMKFEFYRTNRNEAYTGEYETTRLEITFPDNRMVVLEPAAAVTTEYDGKLELYVSGNIKKKITILRKLLAGNQWEWYIYKSYGVKPIKLNKTNVQKIIDEWIS